MGEHREFVASFERMGEGVWSVDDQIADPSQEVVRCRDCNFSEQPEGQGGVFCLRMCFLIDDEGLGFCSWGERKDA